MMTAEQIVDAMKRLPQGELRLLKERWKNCLAKKVIRL